MESDGIIIGVCHGGSWYKEDDGSWKFKDYESEVTEVPKKCTLDNLKDEMYNLLNLDRDTCLLKMKFEYVLSSQPLAPKEIRSDRDVRIFLRQVKEVVPITPLFVEIIQMHNDDPNHGRCPFKSGSGSNQKSSPLERRMKGKEKLNSSYVNLMPEVDDQIQQDDLGWETQVPESQWPETQFPDVEAAPETQCDWNLPVPETNFPYAEEFEEPETQHGWQNEVPET